EPSSCYTIAKKTNRLGLELLPFYDGNVLYTGTPERVSPVNPISIVSYTGFRLLSPSIPAEEGAENPIPGTTHGTDRPARDVHVLCNLVGMKVREILSAYAGCIESHVPPCYMTPKKYEGAAGVEPTAPSQ
ncbi:MAG TPA: hypothetical protein VK850_04505, partial [Candidatus Binatia bacterium]|nr:hypothetical protein [Candidatus Binatia bacterium]